MGQNRARPTLELYALGEITMGGLRRTARVLHAVRMSEKLYHLCRVDRKRSLP